MPTLPKCWLPWTKDWMKGLLPNDAKPCNRTDAIDQSFAVILHINYAISYNTTHTNCQGNIYYDWLAQVF